MPSMVWQEKKNSFKPAKLHLKTDLVPHPACVEECSKYILLGLGAMKEHSTVSRTGDTCIFVSYQACIFLLGVLFLCREFIPHIISHIDILWNFLLKSYIGSKSIFSCLESLLFILKTKTIFLFQEGRHVLCILKKYDNVVKF